MTIPTSFKAINFMHSLRVVSSSVEQKDRRIIQGNTSGTLNAPSVQPVCEPLQLLSKKAGLRRLSNPSALYMWYDEYQALFLILSKGSKGLYCMQRNTSLRKAGINYPRQKVLIMKRSSCQCRPTIPCVTQSTFCSALLISLSSFLSCMLKVQNETK